MADKSPFSITFWGVRGSIPTPGQDTLVYGGETACMEVRIDGKLIIVDCGSGARGLGNHMLELGDKHADLLFTHTHLDHIIGLPFFVPAFAAGMKVTLHAGHLGGDGAKLRRVLERVMSPPIFPVAIDVLKACSFHTFTTGETICVAGGVKVDTIKLNHPDGATGYRFRSNDHTLCIITDHEHGNKEIDDAIVEFVRDCDVMVYDATYTPEEYEHVVGWGHSTWTECLKVAERANVKTPVIFHHEPYRTDEDLDRIANELERCHCGAIIAKQGLVLDID